MFVTPPPVGKYCDAHVCLSHCLCVCVSVCRRAPELQSNPREILCMLPMAVARSFLADFVNSINLVKYTFAFFLVCHSLEVARI